MEIYFSNFIPCMLKSKSQLSNDIVFKLQLLDSFSKDFGCYKCDEWESYGLQNYVCYVAYDIPCSCG